MNKAQEIKRVYVVLVMLIEEIISIIASYFTKFTELPRVIKILIIASLVMVANMFVIISVDTDSALAANNIIDAKSFKSVQIEEGDTLWSIALEYADTDYITYDEYIEEVMDTNNLSVKNLQVGMYLYVPYYNK